MKLKRLVAGVLSAAMMLSIGSTLAFATEDGDTSVDSIDFTTTMYIGATAITAPEFSYSYTVAGTNTTETFTVDGTTTYVYAGVGEVTAALATGETEDAFVAGVYTDSTKTVTYTLDFSGITSEVTHAGIYHYTLTESGEDSTDGVVNQSDREYDIYVTVSNGADGGLEVTDVDMYVDAIALNGTNDGYAAATKAEAFTHTYGIEAVDDNPDPTPEDGKTQDFIVTDIAKGEMANHSKYFSFATVMVEDEDLAGMIFAVTDGYYFAGEDTTLTAIDYVTVGNGGTLYVTTYDSSEDAYTTTETAAVFALKSGEDFTITNVIEGMTFSVTITDPTSDGYDFYARDYIAAGGTDWTYLVLDDGESYETSVGFTAEGTFTAAVDGDYDTVEGISFATVIGGDANEGDDDNIHYTDTNFPDTGVVLDLAPYAIMMVLAAGFIVFRAARKTEE